MLAAKEATSVFPLAAALRLAENSHPAHQLPTAILHPGFGFAISNTAASFHASLYDFRVGSRCSSKERDSETGLDYFGARYMSGAQGRFTSPDPVAISLDISNPQSWNKYTYTFNRPTALVDPDGKWPGWFHHQLDDNFFLGQAHLSKTEAWAIRSGSDWVDGIDRQGPEDSYMHAMRDGLHGQTIAEAQQASERYVETELNAAVNIQLQFEGSGGKGYSLDALARFAHGLHTVQDATSPEHTGYQPWEGLGHPFLARDHSRREEQSAVSQDASDAMARYNAQVETAQIWNRFQAALKRQREADEAAKKQQQP